jgi:ferric-dicitrate binding protein FerR (iron transport regulator)
MEKIKSIFEISEIIAHDISGKLSQYEKELLEEWINNSGQNRKMYRKILDSSNISERNKLYESVNVEQAWKEVSGVLEAQHKKRVWSLVFKYAAAILLPVLLGLTTYWVLNDHSSEIAHQVVQIQSGSRNAVLVMANGKSVDLVNDTTKNLIENDGTVIKNSVEELSYVGQSAKKTVKTIFNTLIVPKGGEYSLFLSDGTRIFVNSMSKLVFPVRFSGDKREITLEEGEAYFEVAKDKSKPFIVTVKGIQVEVLGTSFNIKAYPEDTYSYTTLVEGSVKLNPNDQPSNIHIMEPDQQAVFNPASAGIIINKVDAKQIVQWTTGKYSFTNETLDEIMKTLSRWYDFNYKFEDESLKKIRFEGGLNKYESIDPILDIIAKTKKVKVLVKGKEVSFLKIG